MVRHSQFRMPNTKWGANILCRSKMADLVPLKFAHKIHLLSPSIHMWRGGGVILIWIYGLVVRVVCADMFWYAWFASLVIPYLTSRAPILY